MGYFKLTIIIRTSSVMFPWSVSCLPEGGRIAQVEIFSIRVFSAQHLVAMRVSAEFLQGVEVFQAPPLVELEQPSQVLLILLVVEFVDHFLEHVNAHLAVSKIL